MKIVDTTPSRDWIAVSPSSLSPDELTAWAVRANCGAVVTFCGTVRNTSGDLSDVQALEYETEPALAERGINEVVAEARRRWPMVEAIAVHHRTGRVELSEIAVVVAVSSPHRHEAFVAAEFCIEAVKKSVPLWKRELWPGGSAWSSDVQPILKARDI
jgi:molybdopterin synthase catalytic subunit